MSEKQPFLVIDRVSKNFAGVQALNEVSLEIQSGEVLCLVGENGSGKSTLIKTISGVHQPTRGTITINGNSYTHLRPIDSIHEGIQVIYQDFSLFPNLTVAENIAINAQVSSGKAFVNWGEVRRIAQEAIERIDVKLPLGRRVEQLSVAEKQLTAIARAILQDARLIIMDEPTTALTEKEVNFLFKVIRNLQQRGISIVFVSHKLNEVLEVAEHVVILRNGEKVLDTTADDLDQNKIAYHMTGLEIQEAPYHYTPADAHAAPLLEVEHVSARGGFQDVSFRMHPGEIIGITGLLGSGRTELALSLFGVNPVDAGTIRVNGKVVKIRSIQDAIRHGIGYVPEDRLTEGLFLEQSIGNNIVIRRLRELVNNLGLLVSDQMQDTIKRWVGDLSIKTSDPRLPVQSLSGGNQQRVVLAKWLASNPRILILNGPTVGVDIGSKTELHGIIKDLARGGMGIIIISDDIPELMNTCNRILLMRSGRITDEYVTREIDSAKLSEVLQETDKVH